MVIKKGVAVKGLENDEFPDPNESNTERMNIEFKLAADAIDLLIGCKELGLESEVLLSALGQLNVAPIDFLNAVQNGCGSWDI